MVTVGLTDGFASVEENPDGTELQLYVLPSTAAAPMVELSFKQMARLSPAVAAGSGFTVTVTLPVLLQPVSVMVSVSVYVVVTVGLTVGFCKVDVNPTGTEVQL